jgi:hypothetical protein
MAEFMVIELQMFPTKEYKRIWRHELNLNDFEKNKDDVSIILIKEYYSSLYTVFQEGFSVMEKMVKEKDEVISESAKILEISFIFRERNGYFLMIYLLIYQLFRFPIFCIYRKFEFRNKEGNPNNGCKRI